MRLYKPEVFQGNLGKKKYFEGWYLKTVSAPEIFAVIPGVSLSTDSHAFIQLIDGSGHTTEYIRFPLSDFSYSTRRFEAEIGLNYFSTDGYRLNIETDRVSVKGELVFANQTPYPGNFVSPGIMGPYSYLPFMECYHGVVSADHEVSGRLLWNGRERIMDGGRGYIEKDWGRSMPSSWIWCQSNCFEEPGTSVMLSIAKIPWLGRSFTGFLGFVCRKGRYYTFSTYNRSRYFIDRDDPGVIRIDISGRRHRMRLRIPIHDDGGELLAPVDGGMERTIREHTDTEIMLELIGSSGELIFGGTGKYCGFEMTGNTDELMQ